MTKRTVAVTRKDSHNFMKKKNRPKPNPGRSSENRQKIPLSIQLKLWVRAGGRCEFYGCNEYLYRDSLTLKETNYSNIAHIVAVKPDGPRGKDPLPVHKRNQIKNFMLTCRKHHWLIDSKEHEHEYPKEILLGFKKGHEDRILRLTGSQPHHKTTLIRLRANIGTQAVDIPLEHIEEAIFPRYPADSEGIEIDLTSLHAQQKDAYWSLAAAEITGKLKDLHTEGLSKTPIDHVSVFALAPMPLLVHLGHTLSNKIPADLYQRHRDTENWIWKQDGDPLFYEIRRLKEGTDPKRVGVMLSLSGTISLKSLPEEVLRDCSLYEVTLKGAAPNATFLRRKEDLERFRGTYHELLGMIRQDHPESSEILLFPVVPAPVAVTCGRELLPKAHPSLLVYDFDKKHNIFKFTLKVN